MSIDLHTHSTVSDGTQTPAELLAQAQKAGVDTVALTDHDTTAGWPAAAAALPTGMTLLPGAEISCQYEAAGSRPVVMHLLAYGFDASYAPLAERLTTVRQDRLVRAERIVDSMAADGIAITWAQVQRLAAGGTVGRPHIARALVDAGVEPSVDAAFAGLISSASPYYRVKADIPVLDAIEMVSAAGGVTVFAHPLRRGRHVPFDGIEVMRDAGLRGIEVDHPDHDAAARTQLARVAAELALVPVGSSDYHGSNKTTPIAACTTSRASFEALVEPVRSQLLVG